MYRKGLFLKGWPEEDDPGPTLLLELTVKV